MGFPERIVFLMKNTVQEMTCIVCPNGCRLQVMEKDGKIEVTGAACKKGIVFAENELKNPARSIASTVKTIYPDCPYLSVKTDGELPKGRIMEAMEQINAVTLKKRLPVGGVVLRNVFGVNVVATSDMTASPSPCRVRGEAHETASADRIV